jgi:hypothetical protein
LSEVDAASEGGGEGEILKSQHGDRLAPPKKISKKSRTKKGFMRLGAMPFKSTTDLTASLAQGLHNVPKLYGDKTVRTPEKITGWQSGLKAAGKVCDTEISSIDIRTNRF